MFRLYVSMCVLLSIAIAEDCALTMWVFESLTQCDNTDRPSAIGTIYADGNCRAVESSSFHDLFPNYYTARCTAEGNLRIENSGCLSDTCAPGPSGVCETDATVPGHLFSRFETSEYIVQQKEAGSYTCFQLQRSDNNPISVTFAIFGDCSTPACQQHVAPIPDTTAPALPTIPLIAEPAITPPLLPLTWRPYTPAPTPSTTTLFAPSSVTIPIKFIPPTPIPEALSGVRLTLFPTHFPTRSPTKAPTARPSDRLALPGFIPVFPLTATPTTTTKTSNGGGDIETLTGTVHAGLQLAEMSGLMQAADMTEWKSITEQHIMRSVPEVLMAKVGDVVQQQFADKELQVQFHLIVERAVGSDTEAKQLFVGAFDEENERINYVRDLLTSSSVFGSLHKVSVVGDDDDDSDEGDIALGSTLKESSLAMNVLIASIVAPWLIVSCCVSILLFRRRHISIGSESETVAETAGMSTMGGSGPNTSCP